MGGGDGEAEFGGEEDGCGSAEFGGEAAGGCELGDLFADGFDDAPAPGGEAEDDADAAEGEEPGGDGGGFGEGAVFEEVEYGSEGADGVGNVVGAVTEGDEAGGEDLEGDEHLLDVAVAGGALFKAGLFAYGFGEVFDLVEDFSGSGRGCLVAL